MEIYMKPIAYIRSAYSPEQRPPRQSIYNLDDTAFVEVLPEFRDAMLGMEAGFHFVITFYFHESTSYVLQHFPKGGRDKITGLFMTRSPHRPNGIGISICEAIEIRADGFVIRGVDMYDGTPVLDIKPYVKELNPPY